MSDNAAKDYDQLKEALLKRYDLTEDGFRTKFREAKPEIGESPEQFIIRLRNYLSRWIELSNTTEDFESVCNLFVKEQFTDSCPKDLAIHVRERAPSDLEELAKIAEQYLIAHGKHLAQGQDNKQKKKNSGQASEKSSLEEKRCYSCGELGHIKTKCPKLQQGGKPRCFKCDRFGHLASECRTGSGKKSGQKAAAAVNVKLEVDSDKREYASADDIDACIDNGEILLAGGKKVPLVNSACIQPIDEQHENMPVVKGMIGDTEVEVLRDTGCSGVVVKKDFVKEDQYTEKFAYMRLIDNSMRKVPIVKITVDTPYFTGETEAQCLPDAIYDLIIGNIPMARRPTDPDPDWHKACAVTTRAQAKKEKQFTPLKVLDNLKSVNVSKEKLVEMQQQDHRLDKFREMKEPRIKGQQQVDFKIKGDVLYHLFTHPEVNNGKQIRQVVVPTDL